MQADPDLSRRAGYLMHALFIGLPAKFLLDPAQAPTPAELADGLRIIAGRLASPVSGG